MTESTGALRRKIEGARELQSVVRTMKAVAASSIGQYQQSVAALHEYFQTIELGLSACFQKGKSFLSDGELNAYRRPLVGAVVFGSDQGLVGQFNESIADFALESLQGATGQTSIWAVGERVHTRLTDTGQAMLGLFDVPNSVQSITPLVGQILVATEARHQRGELTELHLFYNRPTSEAAFAPVRQKLIPLDETWHHNLASRSWPTKAVPEVWKNQTTILQALIREYLFVSLFRACADSLASENASRLAAMQRADKSINELLEELSGTFYRRRQGNIDEELFDVISGFEALGPLNTEAQSR